jgi:pimeloyl-ACP methyl ester carboxylesterase
LSVLIWSYTFGSFASLKVYGWEGGEWDYIISEFLNNVPPL